MLFYLHLASFKTSDKSSKQNFVLGLKFRLLLKHSGYVIGHEMQDKQGWVMWLDYIVISNMFHHRPFKTKEMPRNCSAKWQGYVLSFLIFRGREQDGKGGSRKINVKETGSDPCLSARL